MHKGASRERRWDRNIVVWHDVEHCRVLEFLCVPLDDQLSPDLSFLFQNSQTAASAGLPKVMLVCMCTRAIMQLFSKMMFIFLKLPFTIIISTLLLLLFEAFHIVGVTGTPLSTHLDSFSMLTTAPKSKLKNPAFLHQGVTLEHTWMLLHFEKEEQKATFKHSIPTEPCWDLQLPTHSTLVTPHTLSQLPLFTHALN